MEKKFKIYYCANDLGYKKNISEISVSTEEKKKQIIDLLKSEGYEVNDSLMAFLC